MNPRTNRSEQPYPIKPNTGGPLHVDDVIGRDTACADALSRARGGNNLLLADPRRMGKSVLLTRMAHLADRHDLVVIIDFQGCLSVDEFLNRLLTGLSRHATIGARFRKAAGGLIERFEGGPELEGVQFNVSMRAVDRRILLGRILNSVAGRLADDELLLIACDEVPLGVEGIARNASKGEAVALLETLRALRTEVPKIRWLLTGSVGFHHVVRIIGTTIGVVGDMGVLKLGPLADDDAVFLGECLLLGIGRHGHPGTARAMAAAAGNIPYLMHQIAHLMSNDSGMAPPDAADLAMVQFVDDRDQGHAFVHMLTRVDKYYGRDLNLADRVLDYVALTQPVTATQLKRALRVTARDMDRLRNVIDWLIDDHYLITPDSAIRWRYDVLRRAWIVRRRLQ